MKKQYVSLLAFLIAAGTFYSSCDNKMNKRGALEFSNIQQNEAAHLFGDTTKPGAKLIIDFEYVSKSNDDSLLTYLNDHFISICFDEEYIDTDMATVVKSYSEAYTAEYRMDMEPMFIEDKKVNNREDQEIIASWYDYYQNIHSHIQLYQGDLLVYCVEFNEYTGGADKIEHTNFLNIDLKNRDLITLDDLFIEDYSDALTQLLWEQLMKDNKVSSREELEDIGYGLTGDLTPTENFYVDKTGIVFFYNVYEIAPYSTGSVEIKLSYGAIAHLMKDVKIISALQKSK
ncbi:RsiV family protein [Bacteroides sp. 519]|uniref:RsiV family protein n=1 Tax=Bacteroides sp. 519 TaxID=2302937 RepID=UPI0013D43535|nr:RsiV family protein [Bacteroides sp. 519]NDV58451.1 DUF3298 domain-containing protein [Bacteroides sp. 519]